MIILQYRKKVSLKKTEMKSNTSRDGKTSVPPNVGKEKRSR